MYFFKKPISVLYILLSIVVLSLAFQNCSAPFESTGISAGGDTDAGNLSVDEAKSVEIFEQTLYTKIQENCAACHGALQQPLFATANSLDSHRLIFQKEYVDLENPENSFFAIKIRAGHNKFSVELADEFVASVTKWSTDLKAAMEAPEEEDPVVEDPVVEDPVVEDPVVEDPVVEDPVVEEPEETATFSKVNSTILVPKCVACHKPKSEGGFGTKDNYLTYETILSTGSVVAGNSSASTMFIEADGGKMPPTEALTIEEVALIKAWIDAGAKNN